MNEEIKYRFLDREKAEVYRAYLTEELWERKGEKQIFFLGACRDKTVLGIAVFEVQGNAAQLLWITVSKSRRRQGIGRMLVHTMRNRLDQAEIVSLGAAVSKKEQAEGTVSAFLKACGLREDGERILGSFSLEAALQNELLGQAAEIKPEQIRSFSQMEESRRRSFFNFLVQKKLYFGAGSKIIIENSSMFFLEQDKIRGCILFSEKNREPVAEYVFVSPECGDRAALIRMLARALVCLAQNYDKKCIVRTAPLHPALARIFAAVLPDGFQEEAINWYVRNRS